MIRRFSSRQGKLDHLFLREKLLAARRYDRIAGYFRSSLLELVYEDLAAIERVRVVQQRPRSARPVGGAHGGAAGDGAAREVVRAAAGSGERARPQPLSEAPRAAGAWKPRGARGRARQHAVPARQSRRRRRPRRSALAFIGSNNETRQGWREHYEILWEDDDPEAVTWVREEFEYLWAQGIALPDAIIDEVDRCARRTEFRRVEDVPAGSLAAAAMAEAPIYARGEALMPWQQAFVTLFMQQRETYPAVRLLLADEVGLGKTLSLATAAVLASLLGDGPVLILCPVLPPPSSASPVSSTGTPSTRRIDAPEAWSYRVVVLRGRGHKEHVKKEHVEDDAKAVRNALGQLGWQRDAAGTRNRRRRVE